MNLLIEILATLTDAVFLLVFVPAIMGVSIKKKKWTIAFPVLYFVEQLIFDMLLPGFAFLPVIILFLIAFFFSLSLCRERIAWSVFTSCAFVVVMMLVSTLLFSVFSLYIPNPEVLLQGSKMSIRVLIILIGKVVLFACYQLLSKLFSKEKSIININAMMMFGLTIGTAIGLAVLMKIASVIENVDADVEILILASILVLLNVIFYLLIWQNQKMQKHEYELQLIAERISNYEKHSDEVAIIWDNIKSVKHDLNNHFLYLQAQLELGNTEKCKTYLSEIQSEVSKMGKLFKTGNDVIDYMINVKMSRLTETQILVSGNAGEFADILDADMTCILGNILDNAIEALEKVKKNKRLELHFSSTKNCRIILCKNSVDESVLNVNSELNTTKSDAEHHGFGHVIIEDIVQKYGGFTDYFEDDEMFGVQISIPMIIN